MSSDLNTIQVIATAIRRREFTESLATALQTLLSQPEDAERLMQKIIQEEDAVSKEHLGALIQAELHLEALYNFHEQFACALMPHLWMLTADTIGGYEVCDPIGLYLEGFLKNSTQPRDLVRKQIQYYLRPEDDPDEHENFLYFLEISKPE